MSQPNVVTATPQASLWEDFIDIIVAPASVFRRREHGSWLIPLVIVTIVIAVIAFASRGVMQPVMDAEFERVAEGMRKNPQITEEMIDRARSVGHGSGRMARSSSRRSPSFSRSSSAWLVAKLVDSRQTLHAAMVVAAYAFVPRSFSSS